MAKSKKRSRSRSRPPAEQAPPTKSREDDDDDDEDQPRGPKRLSKPLVRESSASKAAMTSRLRLLRLERAVERLEEKLRHYVVVVEKKYDPDRLRGAARPWEEVEEAKYRDNHDPAEDLIEKHGQGLCAAVPEAREWRDALVDLAKVRVDQGREDAATELCQRALAIDSADARGAGILVIKSHPQNESQRCIPAWTRVLHGFFQNGSSPIPALDDVNPYAKYCLAFPDAFDACLEYATDIGDTFAPGGKLEALQLHHCLRNWLFSSDSDDDNRDIRNQVAEAIRGSLLEDGTKIPPPPPFQGDESHKDASMYATMFDTAVDMAQSQLASS